MHTLDTYHSMALMTVLGAVLDSKVCIVNECGYIPRFMKYKNTLGRKVFLPTLL